MNPIQSFNTTNSNVIAAVEELSLHLHKQPKLILFFSSSNYDFKSLNEAFLAKFPNADIVGVTTTGEIGPNGFSEFSLSAQSYTNEIGNIEAVLMNDIAKYPIFERKKLMQTANKAGINVSSKQIQNEGLAFIFPVGLKAGEENMLSVVNSIFEYDGFSIFGGTAGDDAKFNETFVSVNGEITANGGAVVFIKPTVDYFIFRENIFKSTSIKMKITKADPEKRIVYEINGVQAAKAYAQALNVPVNQLSDHWSLHPLGRKFNDDYYNASPFTVHKDGAVEFYCQVFEGAVLEVLEPLNPLEQLSNTVSNFTSEFTHLEGVLAVNCILRKLQFKQQNIFKSLNEEISQLPNLCGFSSYGEQINKSQLNQTMVLIGFGRRK